MEQDPKPLTEIEKLSSYAVMLICFYGINKFRNFVLSQKPTKNKPKSNSKDLPQILNSDISNISLSSENARNTSRIRDSIINQEKKNSFSKITKLSISTKLRSRVEKSLSLRSSSHNLGGSGNYYEKSKTRRIEIKPEKKRDFDDEDDDEDTFIALNPLEIEDETLTTDFLKNTKIGFNNDSILSNLKDLTARNKSFFAEKTQDTVDIFSKFGEFFEEKFFEFFECLSEKSKKKFIFENPNLDENKFCHVDENEAFYRSRVISELEMELKFLIPKLKKKSKNQRILGLQILTFQLKNSPELPIYIEFSGDSILMLKINDNYIKHSSIYWAKNKLELTEELKEGKNKVEILYGTRAVLEKKLDEKLIFKNSEQDLSIFPMFNQSNIRISKLNFICLIPDKNQDLKFNKKVSDEKLIDNYQTDDTIDAFKSCFKTSMENELKGINFTDQKLQNFLFYFASDNKSKHEESDLCEFTYLKFHTYRNCTHQEICFYLNYDFESLELFDTLKIENCGKEKIVELFKRDDLKYDKEKIRFLADLIEEFFSNIYELMDLEITIDKFSLIIDDFKEKEKLVSNVGNMIFVKEALVKSHSHQISENGDNHIYLIEENLLIQAAYDLLNSFSGMIFGSLISKKNKHDDYLIKGIKGYVTLKLLQISNALDLKLMKFCQKRTTMKTKITNKTHSNITFQGEVLTDRTERDQEIEKNNYKIEIPEPEFDESESIEEIESLEVNELLLTFINFMREKVIEFDSSIQATPLKPYNLQEEDDSQQQEIPDYVKETKFYFLLNQLEIPYIQIFKSLGDLSKAYLYESINLDDFISFISENLQEIDKSSINSEISSECLDNDEKSILKSKFFNSIFAPGINTISIEISKSKRSSKIESFKLIQKDHCHLNAGEPILRNQKFEVKLFNSTAEITNMTEIEIKGGFPVKQVYEFYQKRHPKAVLFNSNCSRLVIEELGPKTLAFFTEYFSFLKNVNDKLLFIHYLNRHCLYLEFLKVALIAIKFEENSCLLFFILKLSGKILNSIFGGFNKFGFDFGKGEESEKNEGFLQGKNIRKNPKRHRRGRSKHYEDIKMNDSRNKIFFAVIDRLKEEKNMNIKRAIVSAISPIIDYRIAKMYIVEEEWRLSPRIGENIIQILVELMKFKLIIFDNGKKKSFNRCFKKIKRSHSMDISGNYHPFSTIQKLEKNIIIGDFENTASILQKVKYRKELKEENYVEYFEKLYEFLKSRPPLKKLEIYFPVLIQNDTKFTTCVSEICDIIIKEKMGAYSVQLKILTEELIKRIDACVQIREDMS